MSRRRSAGSWTPGATPPTGPCTTRARSGVRPATRSTSRPSPAEGALLQVVPLGRHQRAFGDVEHPETALGQAKVLRRCRPEPLAGAADDLGYQLTVRA